MPRRTLARLGTAAVMVGLVAAPSASLAITGAGCADLPEYYRALGTLQLGPGACNMTVAEAKAVLAREGRGFVDEATPPPAPRRHHRRHPPHP